MPGIFWFWAKKVREAPRMCWRAGQGRAPMRMLRRRWAEGHGHGDIAETCERTCWWRATDGRGSGCWNGALGAVEPSAGTAGTAGQGMRRVEAYGGGGAAEGHAAHGETGVGAQGGKEDATGGGAHEEAAAGLLGGTGAAGGEAEGQAAHEETAVGAQCGKDGAAGGCIRAARWHMGGGRRGGGAGSARGDCVGRDGSSIAEWIGRRCRGKAGDIATHTDARL